MNFTSLEYLTFFLVVYGAYLILRLRGQNVLLLIASYFFYGSWDWRFLSLIMISTVIDFYAGQAIHKATQEKRKKFFLLISLGANLGMLGVFKYFNFFADSFMYWAAGFGWQPDLFFINIVLPVGISFYTFQTLSYSIDIYRGDLKPTKDFLNFALFVSFFPQLVAGPIERAKNLLPEIENKRDIGYEEWTRGLFLIMQGLFKKVVIADGVAPSVNAIFSSNGEVAWIDLVLATNLFALQIYGDFSGYTDIARGTAKMFGINLRTNFNMPYFAQNPPEFWQRWHISLSSWLRDYLYIPLGGNRGGTGRTYFNLMATMLLGGLWHGAAWNFVLWGFYQGLILIVHRVLSRYIRILPQTEYSLIRRIVTPFKIFAYFQVTLYGWLLFRVESLDQALLFTKTLFTGFSLQAPTLPTPPTATGLGIFLIILMEITVYFLGDWKFYRKWPLVLRSGLYALILLCILMGVSNVPAEFIYFQF